MSNVGIAPPGSRRILVFRGLRGWENKGLGLEELGEDFGILKPAS